MDNGPNEESPTWLVDLYNDTQRAWDWLPDWSVRLLTIVAILLIAILIQRVTRRSIKNAVYGLQGDVVQRRLSSIRRRTPRALLNTGESITLRRAQRAETIGTVLRSASTVIISIVALTLVARNLGVPSLGALGIGIATIATAAIGFGGQNIVKDFLSGIFIVLEDQYGVGDFIDVGKASGTVESVSLRTTRLRSEDGRLFHVSNGEIRTVGNFSQQWSRAVIEFSVSLETDIPTAIRLIKNEADDMWNDSAYAGVVIDEPEIWGPESIDSQGILIKLAVKTKPLEQWQVARTLRSRIKKAMDKAGIEIAMPPAGTVLGSSNKTN